MSFRVFSPGDVIAILKGLKSVKGSKILLLYLLGFLGLLFINDVILTEWILAVGGVEYNPFMVALTANPLYHLGVKLVAFLIITLLVYGAERFQKSSGCLITSFAIGMYIVVNLHSVVWLTGGSL